jgi:hypothetical protein
MKRWSGAAGVSLLLALGVAGPAYAQQYNDPTTTSTTTSSTSTTVQATTTTTAPPPPKVEAPTVSNTTPAPGDPVAIGTPPASSPTLALDTTKPAAAVLVTTDDDKADVPMPAPKLTKNADGSVKIEVTIPPATPPGVYVLAVVATDVRGQSRVVIVPVVVRRKGSAAALSASAAPVVPVAVPAEARKVAASVAKAGGSDAVTDAVLHDDAQLKIEHDQLVVFRPGQESSTDGSRPLVAAFAVALAGGGLLLLRRRTPQISKRSR